MLVLKRERIRRGWSLTKLCVKTGIDPGAISRIERRIWPCGPGWRQKLAAAFDMSEEELFQEEVAGHGEGTTSNK